MSSRIVKGRDILGREINVGDYIVYGAAKGRCAGLNIGRVVARVNGKVRARAVIEWWGEYKPAERLVTLLFTERMCVVPAESLPTHLVNLLNPLKNP